jgi:hypothetical protein
VTRETWPIAIRYHPRGDAALRLNWEAYWDTYGFALRDGADEEHHFGFPERARSQVVFTFVASYNTSGRCDDPGVGVHDKLVERGYELVEATLGPRLNSLVTVALAGLAEFAARKGFAFDPERELAVRTLGALRRVRETFDPDEIWVWAATHGFRGRDAAKLKEYAQRAIDGAGTRTVNGYAIRLDPRQADLMIDGWRSERESSPTAIGRPGPLQTRPPSR